MLSAAGYKMAGGDREPRGMGEDKEPVECPREHPGR